MYQKIGLKMATSYSPNFNLPKRAKNRIVMRRAREDDISRRI